MATTVPSKFSQYLGGGALYANKGLLQAVMVKLAISALIRVEICIVQPFLRDLTVMDGADGQAIGTAMPRVWACAQPKLGRLIAIAKHHPKA